MVTRNNMVTRNILQRTFWINHGKEAGTCFTIDIENKQYIVTASHVIKGLFDTSETQVIRIYHDGQWKNLEVTLVGHSDVDVSVITAKRIVSQTLQLEPQLPLYVTEDVYFLGFPYGIKTEPGKMNLHFPMPLVKKAMVSAIVPFEGKGDLLLLDGHNNLGFSGGPVVTKLPEDKCSKVCAVISGYVHAEEKVWEKKESKKKKPTKEDTQLRYNYNTGIIQAYGIKFALDVIEENPIGFDLAEQ